jgi:hypothetical protein
MKLENGLVGVEGYPWPLMAAYNRFAACWNIRNRPGAVWESRAIVNTQSLVLTLEDATYNGAVRRLFLQRFRVPLASSRIEEIATVNVNPTGESQQGIGHRMKGIRGQHCRIFFEQGIRSERLDSA